MFEAITANRWSLCVQWTCACARLCARPALERASAAGRQARWRPAQVPSFVREQIKSMQLLGYRGPHTKLGRSNSNLRSMRVGANGSAGANGSSGNGAAPSAAASAPAKAA